MNELVEFLKSLDDRLEKLEKEVGELKEKSDGKELIKAFQQGLKEKGNLI